MENEKTKDDILSDPVVSHQEKIIKLAEEQPKNDDFFDLNAPRIKTLDDQPKNPTIPKKFKKRINYFIISILFLFSFLAIIAIVNYQPKITLTTKPNGSEIRLDGKKIDNISRTISGKHIITVSKEGFKTFEKTLNLMPWQNYKDNISLNAIGQPRLISQKDALSISIDKKENRYFYLRNDGKVIYMVRQLGDSQKTIEERTITPELNPIEKVIFSPDFSLAVIKFQSGETGIYDFNQYDLINQEYTSWGNDIKEIIWRPDGEKLLYQKKTSSGDNALFVNNRLKENEERLLDLRGEEIENPKFSWSQDGNKVIIIGKNNLYLYAYTNKVLSYIAKGDVTSAQILPDSSTIIFTQSGTLKRVKVELISAFYNKPTSEDIGRVNLVEEIKDLKVNLDSSKLVFIPGSDSALYFQNSIINKVNLTNGDISTIYKNPNSKIIVDLIVDPELKSIVYLTEENKIYQIEYKN